ncbi:hypothetical protein JX580_05030 [Thiomicrospira microaerophila]|uniref:type II secretion system protein N n=1 Tax=Thiomicrospira microaerophila TaxID=406020 RepID=UPI0020107346|nr:type II secretion system protein N [Thiomicrospira microaerophila]UQB43240.1 hypothetical protein JX580_05030 [Thiomicrospira microaerophila]
MLAIHLSKALSFVLSLLVALWLGMAVAYIYSTYIERTSSELDLFVGRVPPLDINVPSNPVTLGRLWGESTGLPPTQKIESNPKAEQQAQQQIARLNIELLGVIVSPDYRLAIIKTSNRELILLEGESISQTVQLKSVLPDHVIIISQGISFTLWLDDGRLERQVSSAIDEIDPLLAQQQYNEARIQEVAKSLREKPLSIGNYVQFRILFKNGRWDGVAIAPKNDPEVYRHLGFETNDIIKAVNGHSTHEIATSDQLWLQFLTTDRFEVQVERNGQMESLLIDLTQ